MTTGTRRRERLLGTVLVGQLLAGVVGVSYVASRTVAGPPPAAAPTRARPLVSALADAGRAGAVHDLLAARSNAVLRHDRAAFLATVDPLATAFRTRQAALVDALARVPIATWSYTLDPDSERPGTAARDRRTRWAGDVALRYRLDGGDPAPALRRQHVTFVLRSGRWYVGADDPGLRIQRDLWDDGPVVTARRPGVLVLGHPSSGPLLADLARETEQAVSRVTALWGPGWSRRVLVVVPSSQAELARLVPGAGALDQVAALATADLEPPAAGDHPGPARPVGDRVLVNPPVFARLGTLGRRVVLAHEVTHVASRAASGAAVPTWLVEGLADWIGYSGLDVPLSVSARELQADVRAGRLPDHLPTDAAYDGSDPRLAQTYEQSWRAVSLIASRYGAAALLRLYRDLGRDGRAGALDRVLHRDLGLSLAGLTQAWRQQLQRELG
ncbi:MAG: hypothetical protein H7233_14530 [Pseudorhodobacter sp.]|nr:hypothetical protein [Frankiaceae bacterium]